MILQALNEYYKRKAENSESGIAPLGWEKKELSFLIVINKDGKFLQIEDTRQQIGKKMVARTFEVPKAVKRSSGVAANLLWDNLEYITGVPMKDGGKVDRAKKSHEAFLARLEPYCEIEEVALVKGLVEKEGLIDTLKQTPQWEEMASSGAFVSFRIAENEPVFRNAAFMKKYTENISIDGDGEDILCLVTGEKSKLARLHPSIKGVAGANSTGGNIVSFNDPCSCSYGKSQGQNSPIGEVAAFAYTTALNTLLGKGSRQKLLLGDSTMVFWSAKDSQFENMFADIFDDSTIKDNPDQLTNSVAELLKSVESGSWQNADGETKFYVLGLAPNSARISVRFWHAGTVAEMAGHFRDWFEDTMIEHNPKLKDHLSLKRLLCSTAVLGKSENISPNLAGNVMRAILEGLPMPETLLQSVILRIKAEQGNVTYERAKLIKVCLNRKFEVQDKQERKLTMSLNKENKNIGYRLGRLFAVLERIQECANPGLNATIRDKFYASASATPAAVFGTLMRMKNHHLSKIDKVGLRVNMEKDLGEIIDGIDSYPAHLGIDQQGEFSIGYYHQRQSFFTKKEEI